MAQPVSEVFLDSSSAEPLLPDARRAWLAASDAGWGDPLRLHRPGRLAAQALDRARDVVAQAVGARPDEVVFTASASHSAYAAVAGLARGRRRVGDVVVTTAVDHSAVLGAAAEVGRHAVVEVDRVGRLDLAAWRAAVSAPGVALACLQVGNHEVGTLQPYADALAAAQQAGVPVVLDATSALGRIDCAHLGGWSVLTGGAAAFGGPSSVGLLVLRKGARWRAPYPVDDYQDGRWPGAPDVPAVVAAAAALDSWLRMGRAVGERQRALVDQLRTALLERVPDLEVPGDPVARLPHLLTFSVLYLDGETLTLALDRAGFAVASGSACSARSEHPSHVLAAMGSLTHGNVRVGLTRTTTASQVAAFAEAVVRIAADLRSGLDLP
ncbi:MAG: aminotransferase class [Friedmanniella sp.]|nr:aminotransferase class [Friedmanniella sp.]